MKNITADKKVPSYTNFNKPISNYKKQNKYRWHFQQNIMADTTDDKLLSVI